MKCQILFSGGKKKKNVINLSAAELARRLVKVKATRFSCKCFNSRPICPSTGADGL